MILLKEDIKRFRREIVLPPIDWLNAETIK
jgi:hypothetical protein